MFDTFNFISAHGNYGRWHAVARSHCDSPRYAGIYVWRSLEVKYRKRTPYPEFYRRQLHLLTGRYENWKFSTEQLNFF